MNRVFGKKKAAAPAPTLGQASDSLQTRVDALDHKIQSLEAELRKHKEAIKKTKSPAAKKQCQKKALDVLKRKRMYENQRDAIMGQQFNIDQANFGLSSAQANVQTVAAMKAANTQLKHTMKTELDIDGVDELVDDMAEIMEDLNMFNEELGRNFATPDDIDEADLDAELEMLGDEFEDELADTTSELTTPSYLLPAVPGNTLPEKQNVANMPNAIGNP